MSLYRGIGATMTAGGAAALLAVLACTPADAADGVTLRVTAGSLAESAAPAAAAVAPGRLVHAHPAGPTAEPLILGPALVTAAGLPGAREVAVSSDGSYQVRYGTGAVRVAVVDAETGALLRTTAVDAGSAPAADAHGRVYSADSAAGVVRVLDPAEQGAAPRALLTGLAGPADVAVDARRGRLLVAEQGAGRLRVFELP